MGTHMQIDDGAAQRSIQIETGGGAIEGYAVNGDGEQIPNWLRYRHHIYDQDVEERLRSYARIAFLNNVNVDERMRGKGKGNDLMGRFLEEAAVERAQSVILLADINEEQEKGFDLVGWYERWGFEALAILPEGVLMILEI